MFTGIISDIGTITELTQGDDATHLRIETRFKDIDLGASVACDGICLTATDSGDGYFTVTASRETAAVTTLSTWQGGRTLNLERALKVGDELGGHWVSGHVDGVATLTGIEHAGESWQLTLSPPTSLMPFLARKGSVTLDGISLTVNDVNDTNFTVMIIPHTWEHTTLQHRAKGDALNIEIDVLARYLQRFAQTVAV